MNKYSKEELAELAKGVFASQPNDAHAYANESGTFLNPSQFKKLSAEAKKDYHTFANPKAVVKPTTEEGNKVSALEDEVAELKKKLAESKKGKP